MQVYTIRRVDYTQSYTMCNHINNYDIQIIIASYKTERGG